MMLEGRTRIPAVIALALGFGAACLNACSSAEGDANASTTSGGSERGGGATSTTGWADGMTIGSYTTTGGALTGSASNGSAGPDDAGANVTTAGEASAAGGGAGLATDAGTGADAVAPTDGAPRVATDAGPASLITCRPLDAYCSSSGASCPRSWSEALMPSSWCSPPYETFTVSQDCNGFGIVERAGGDYVELHFYDDSTGELVGVASYLTQSGQYNCLGGSVPGLTDAGYFYGFACSQRIVFCNADAGPGGAH